MTIDGRLEYALERMPALKTGDVNGNRNFLRNTLLEVARDQRHACAAAVINLRADCSRGDAHHAVINAKLD